MTAQRRIHAKPLVYRRAIAEGMLRLRPATVRAIRRGTVEKGDPRTVAEVAGLSALKRTSELIPHCHPVPISGSRVDVRAVRGGIRARAEAEAVARTGVEMEALVAVNIALLTVWDMVKYLEKDRAGQYPTTRLGDVRVVAKRKAALPEAA